MPGPQHSGKDFTHNLGLADEGEEVSEKASRGQQHEKENRE
jgi:hypothetical protein